MRREARPGVAPSLPAAAAALSVQRFVFSQQYRRMCLVARVLMGAAVLSAVFWAAAAWGGLLPSWAWVAISALAVTALFPLVFARSPRSVELMWRTHLKDNGEPVSGSWRTGLAMVGAVRNVPLLWWWAPSERVLVLGVAQWWWCPRILVLAPPWFATESLRRVRRLLRFGPPVSGGRASDVS
ncbi:hypothetical protein GRB31_08540 [Ralstonia solanacearum]|nr:hypothetical protein GRB31_08540 [Ralstonia solanacearum]